METMNIENKAYELTNEDKEKTEACLRRPATVWDAIKEIAIPKLDSYLEQLEPICNTDARKSEFVSIKQHWDAVKNDEAEKAKYIETDRFDDELVRVLMTYAERIGGIHTPSSGKKFSWKMNLQGNIKNWQSNQTMERDKLFKIAVGFGFTPEETERLLFSVLKDDEQMDFNPRLANEMIYYYAMKHKIPLTAEVANNDQTKQPLSVKKMIDEGQNIYLHKMFGDKYENYYVKLIEKCANKFNIFDSFNTTRSSFWLAYFYLDDKNLLNGLSSDDIIFESGSKSQSAVESCYEHLVGTEKAVTSPNLKDVQRSKGNFLELLDVIGYTLDRGILGLYQSSKTKKELYEMMNSYIDAMKTYVEKQPDDTMLSPLDFISPLKNSGLGKFSQTEFGEMITNIIRKKLRRYNDIANEKAEKKQNDKIVHNEDYKYCQLLLDVLEVSFRYLQTAVEKDNMYLYDIYIEMNEVLLYPYFDPKGVGMDIYKYEKWHADNKEPEDYTFTFDNLANYKGYAETTTDNYLAFLEALFDEICIYEQFDHVRLSRGKEEFVSLIEFEPYVIYKISDSRSVPDGVIPLFFSKGRSTSTDNSKDVFFRRKDEHEEFLDSFYDVKKFRDQFLNKSKPYQRKDILKLVFWSFAYNPEYAQITDPEDRVLNFKDYFNGFSYDDEWNAAIEKTQCAMINENNSLDRLLILCAEHSDPIGFLEAAYKLHGKNFKKIF